MVILANCIVWGVVALHCINALCRARHLRAHRAAVAARLEKAISG